MYGKERPGEFVFREVEGSKKRSIGHNKGTEERDGAWLQVELKKKVNGRRK